MLDREEGFHIFSASEGEAGTGVIIFEGAFGWAIPCPESAWPSLLCGNWRIKPREEDGSPTPLFLIARAYVATLYAAEKRRTQSEAIDCPLDAPESARREIALLAWLHLQQDSRADAWAREARLVAVTSCDLVLDNRASDLIGSNEDFIVWLKSFRKNLRANDPRALDVLARYISDLGKYLDPLLKRLDTIENSRLNDFISDGKYLEPITIIQEISPELKTLCKIIGRLASRLGEPPTKTQVRHALKCHPTLKLQELAYETNRFAEFLGRVGFQWLPNGKAGRPAKALPKKTR
jgi:hypothetical protein